MKDRVLSNKIILLLIIASGMLLLAPFIGGKFIPFDEMLTKKGIVFWQIRVPRVLLSFLSGGILAVSGMVFQAIFKNPIASPFTLGASGGAGFGASFYILLGFSPIIYGLPLITVFGFLGAIFSVLIIFFIAKLYQKFDSTVLILSGIIINFFFASLIMLIQYFSNFTEIFKITRWSMGSLQTTGYEAVLSIFVMSLIGAFFLFYHAQDLNLLMVGDDFSLSRGIDIDKVKKKLFVICSLMLGAVVSFCGPISFIGIISPHLGRMIFSYNHRYLWYISFILGGLLLLVCDTISRILIWPVELPVGVLTAILGGPFFIWVMFQTKKNY